MYNEALKNVQRSTQKLFNCIFLADKNSFVPISLEFAIMTGKLEYAELHQDDSIEFSKEFTNDASTGICSSCIYFVWTVIHILLKIFEFFMKNKSGIFGFICIGIAIIINSFTIYTKSLSLSESHIYDYIFTSCTIDGTETMCPSNHLNHTVYFQYDGVYIAPYVERGEFRESVFFEYAFCKQAQIPKYPSNYQRHCNLMNAGIGMKVSLLSGYTLSILTFFHSMIVLMGYCEWNAYHKLNWIFALVSSLCYIIGCFVWYFLGHLDIISTEKYYSETFGGMKIESNHGYAMILIFISAIVSMMGAVSLRYYIWSMKIEDFRYKYDESEISSAMMSTADLNFMNGNTESVTASLQLH